MPIFCAIDFEYRESRNRHPELVSCCLKGRSHKTPLFFWLHNSPSERARLIATLKSLKRENVVFIAHQVMAEARCFLALGLDPLDYNWIDTLIETRQLQNKNHRYQYGRKWSQKQGKFIITQPPPRGLPAMGEQHSPCGYGLVSVVGFWFNTNLDSAHKTVMRDRILAGGPFEPEEMRAILAYNAQDVEYLPLIIDKIQKHNPLMTPTNSLRRGRYAAALAHVETNGIPLDIERIHKISLAYPQIRDFFIEEVNAVYPFYLINKRGGWIKSREQFNKYVLSKGLQHSWPLTDSGAFCTDDKTLERFSYLPAIKALKGSNKAVSSVRTFSPNSLPKFLEYVGDDGRLRPYFNPFGTQTGRNAPPASHFVFAMSSWLRSVIRPRPGRVILAADYSAQEFAVAAAMSGDKKMMAAYNSGDPYLGYAKLTGALKKDADPEKPETKAFRNEMKSSCLGIQYGIGSESLARKMAADCGKKYTDSDGDSFIRLHQKTFPGYWRYLDSVRTHYFSGRPLVTPGGWALFCDNNNERSVGNFMMQGPAADIGRESVIRACEKGLHVVAPLHDCDYVDAPESQIKEQETLLKACMDEAVTAILGDKIRIRIGVDVHKSDQLWVEKKAEKTIELLAPYIESASHDDLAV